MPINQSYRSPSPVPKRLVCINQSSRAPTFPAMSTPKSISSTPRRRNPSSSYQTLSFTPLKDSSPRILSLARLTQPPPPLRSGSTTPMSLPPQQQPLLHQGDFRKIDPTGY